MLDSYEYRKKIKAEEKLNPKKNPNDFNENDYGIMAIGFIILMFFVALFGLAVFFSEEDVIRCEEVGGTYETVGREYSGNSTVSVYSCVK